MRIEYYFNKKNVSITRSTYENYFLVNRIVKYSILILSVVVITVGCSTKKNTGISRFRHSLTTRFNILFNGSESFKEGVKRYEDAYVDDYSQVLPIFIYGNAELASSIKGSMDRTIEKSTKSIKLHSITVKPDLNKSNMSDKDKAFYEKNEYNIYIDDAYLIMAKAFFFQNDYESAIRIFKYIIKQYDGGVKYLAYNWLVRANVQIKDYREARVLLDFLETEIEYPSDLRYQLNVTAADFYLKQQKYKQAEPYVLEALSLVKKRKEKIRLTYIYAQLNEEDKNYTEASELFRQVIKMNPPYEMTFNATLKSAALHTGNSKSIKEELLDMLKDEKNTEYQDQIYFALGEFENRNGNLEQAIEYYVKSTKSVTSNTNQKGVTYLTLANIFFDQTKYLESQAYFDSAVVSLNKDYPGYVELSIKNQYLSKLVTNLRTVSHQDSIQMVAKMSEVERNKFIQEIISNLRKQEVEAQERERAEQLNQMGGEIRSSRPGGLDQTGKWYFYNPSAKSFGEPEFKRRWGNRKLEDNWRRRNKQSVGFEQISESEFSDEILDPKAGLDNKKPEYYMVELPLTDSAMEASHKKIQVALFNVGEVYRNELKDYSMALDAYNELVERYPNGDLKVAAYYSMYKVNLLQANDGKADVYKNMIIRNYPESIYAKVLLDPNYFKQFEKEEADKKNFYIRTLDLYRNRNFSQVISRCDVAMQKYKDTEYIPKYSFLKAISKGEIYGVTIMKPELEKVILNYKTDPVADKSEELLLAIKANELSSLKELDVAERKEENKEKDDAIQKIVTQKTIDEIEKIYSLNSNEEHVFAIVIANESDINQVKFNIINFNLDFFIQQNYVVESKEFNEFSSIITVSKFKNVREGKEFIRQFQLQKESIFENIENPEYQFFIISKSNLERLNQEKMIRDYLLYYRKNYN